MKVTMTFEFNSKEEAAEFLLSKSAVETKPEVAAVEEKKVAPQEFIATTHEVIAPKVAKTKAALEVAKTKAALKVKEEVKEVAKEIPMPASKVPNSAFPSAPATALNPFPAPPVGIPMPNYGATVAAPIAPVQAEAPAWDKTAVAKSIQEKAQSLGQPMEVIQQFFGSLFQQLNMAPKRVGEMNDQELFAFQNLFFQQVGSLQANLA